MFVKHFDRRKQNTHLTASGNQMYYTYYLNEITLDGMIAKHILPGSGQYFPLW